MKKTHLSGSGRLFFGTLTGSFLLYIFAIGTLACGAPQQNQNLQEVPAMCTQGTEYEANDVCGGDRAAQPDTSAVPPATQMSPTAVMSGETSGLPAPQQDMVPVQSSSDGKDGIVGTLAPDVKVSSRFLEFLIGEKKETAQPVRTLCPGGGVFGVKLRTDRVIVTQITTHAQAAGLCVGDIICSVDGIPVHECATLSSLIQKSEGTARLGVCRGTHRMEIDLPLQGEPGAYVLGLQVRDGAAGIGTLTFYDPQTGVFGGLGHGISDPDGSDLLPMGSGVVTDVILGGVTRGAAGAPGELHGALKRQVCGSLYANSECGVFGILYQTPPTGEALPVASRNEVHEGDATLLCTVRGAQRCAYTISLEKIRTDTQDTTKSFRVRITDPDLIARTGGIVRGMSGSPIIQDGKFVGALTHVMVNDPTQGYGIFLENMLDELSRSLPKKSA